MARLKGISWRVRSKRAAAASMAAAVLFCSGCSVYKTDEIRPELNILGGLRVFYDNLHEGFSALQKVGSDTAGSSASHSGALEIGGGAVLTPSISDDLIGTKAPIPETCVDAGDYTAYILQLLQEITSNTSGMQSSLYVRAYHSGYSLVSGEALMIYRVGSLSQRWGDWNYSSHISGTAFPTFINTWLGNMPENVTAISTRRAYILNKLNSTGWDPQSKYLEHAGETGVLDADILSMWQYHDNRNDGGLTLEGFIDLVKNSSVIVDVLPNVKLKCASIASGDKNVLLNPCDSESNSVYFSGIGATSVDPLFSDFNYYENRDAGSAPGTGATYVYSDDYGIVVTFIDGYHKTILAVCSTTGETLSDILGDRLTAVKGIMNSFSNVYDVEGVADKLGREVKMIPSGALEGR